MLSIFLNFDLKRNLVTFKISTSGSDYIICFSSISRWITMKAIESLMIKHRVCSPGEQINAFWVILCGQYSICSLLKVLKGFLE